MTSATYLMFPMLFLFSFLICHPWVSLASTGQNVAVWGVLLGVGRAFFTLSSTMIMQFGGSVATLSTTGSHRPTDPIVMNLIECSIGVSMEGLTESWFISSYAGYVSQVTNGASTSGESDGGGARSEATS